MIRSGTWWIYSEVDSRWRASGHSAEVGMFLQPSESKAKIGELTRLFGDPPTDLEWGYMKD